MFKYARMLSALGIGVLVSMLVPSVAVAEETTQERGYPKERAGLFENVFNGETHRLAESELPPAVRHAARVVIPDGAKPTEAGVEISRDGSVVYSMDFKGPDRSYSVDVSADGRVLSVEHTLTRDELPPQVMGALERWAPNLEVSEYEKSVRADGVVYELVGMAGGQQYIAVIPAHGQSVYLVNYHFAIALYPRPVTDPIGPVIGW